MRDHDQVNYCELTDDEELLSAGPEALGNKGAMKGKRGAQGTTRQPLKQRDENKPVSKEDLPTPDALKKSKNTRTSRAKSSQPGASKSNSNQNAPDEANTAAVANVPRSRATQSKGRNTNNSQQSLDTSVAGADKARGKGKQRTAVRKDNSKEDSARNRKSPAKSAPLKAGNADSDQETSDDVAAGMVGKKKGRAKSMQPKAAKANNDEAGVEERIAVTKRAKTAASVPVKSELSKGSSKRAAPSAAADDGPIDLTQSPVQEGLTGSQKPPRTQRPAKRQKVASGVSSQEQTDATPDPPNAQDRGQHEKPRPDTAGAPEEGASGKSSRSGEATAKDPPSQPKARTQAPSGRTTKATGAGARSAAPVPAPQVPDPSTQRNVPLPTAKPAARPTDWHPEDVSGGGGAAATAAVGGGINAAHIAAGDGGRGATTYNAGAGDTRTGSNAGMPESGPPAMTQSVPFLELQRTYLATLDELTALKESRLDSVREMLAEQERQHKEDEKQLMDLVDHWRNEAQKQKGLLAAYQRGKAQAMADELKQEKRALERQLVQAQQELTREKEKWWSERQQLVNDKLNLKTNMQAHIIQLQTEISELQISQIQLSQVQSAQVQGTQTTTTATNTTATICHTIGTSPLASQQPTYHTMGTSPLASQRPTYHTMGTSPLASQRPTYHTMGTSPLASQRPTYHTMGTSPLASQRPTYHTMGTSPLASQRPTCHTMGTSPLASPQRPMHQTIGTSPLASPSHPAAVPAGEPEEEIVLLTEASNDLENQCIALKEELEQLQEEVQTLHGEVQRLQADNTGLTADNQLLKLQVAQKKPPKVRNFSMQVDELKETRTVDVQCNLMPPRMPAPHVGVLHPTPASPMPTPTQSPCANSLSPPSPAIRLTFSSPSPSQAPTGAMGADTTALELAVTTAPESAVAATTPAVDMAVITTAVGPDVAVTADAADLAVITTVGGVDAAVTTDATGMADITTAVGAGVAATADAADGGLIVTTTAVGPELDVASHPVDAAAAGAGAVVVCNSPEEISLGEPSKSPLRQGQPLLTSGQPGPSEHLPENTPNSGPPIVNEEQPKQAADNNGEELVLESSQQRQFTVIHYSCGTMEIEEFQSGLHCTLTPVFHAGSASVWVQYCTGARANVANMPADLQDGMLCEWHGQERFLQFLDRLLAAPAGVSLLD